jgi:hypothetical protein
MFNRIFFGMYDLTLVRFVFRAYVRNDSVVFPP